MHGSTIRILYGRVVWRNTSSHSVRVETTENEMIPTGLVVSGAVRGTTRLLFVVVPLTHGLFRVACSTHVHCENDIR